MISPLLRNIENPIRFLTPKGKLTLFYPESADLEIVINILKKEELDLRRLWSVSDFGYLFREKEYIENLWLDSVSDFYRQFPNETITLKKIESQHEAMINYMPFLKKGTIIQDPFNMKIIEKREGVKKLAQQQLRNTLIGKFDNQVIAFGRLLEVEGSAELVSLWTDIKFRRMGIAGKIVELLIAHATKFPIYSFQKTSLIRYYLTEYRKNKFADVVSFDQIPKPLQRDLFYMNAFWGLYTIIKINT